ncbi:MAG: dTDP-4-dehydrorhamnose 3,5-epimerase family protein [Rhodospirillales bacterium]|nr:dTDP-4-dehydrorhamnose 3,5-epimerase family protein [Rhodospirillales bacterium]
MIFRETSLPGVQIIRVEELGDVRGFFARIWCEHEFGKHGLAARMVQASVSYNKKRGTLRGMHYQTHPSEEARLVRCIRGAAFAAVVDLRPHSPAFLQSLSETLSAAEHTAIYVPAGCALGFQTLEDETEILYQMSTFYTPEYARGFRWDDPVFGLHWPEDERTILERDRSYPDFDKGLVADLQHHPL